MAPSVLSARRKGLAEKDLSVISLRCSPFPVDAMSHRSEARQVQFLPNWWLAEVTRSVVEHSFWVSASCSSLGCKLSISSAPAQGGGVDCRDRAFPVLVRSVLLCLMKKPQETPLRRWNGRHGRNKGVYRRWSWMPRRFNQADRWWNS